MRGLVCLVVFGLGLILLKVGCLVWCVWVGGDCFCQISCIKNWPIGLFLGDIE